MSNTPADQGIRAVKADDNERMTKRAAGLTSIEWNYIIELLATEIDCNENPKAISALKKLMNRKTV